ncbi:hypothetical protein Syun_027888 [Stephania yunnanensis]|uniref:Uncharacterized protein n=1 Tax=Stephania yunnanensis TaxID=152371 RepID=A0AAP0EJQ8_9MAGN
MNGLLLICTVSKKLSVADLSLFCNKSAIAAIMIDCAYQQQTKSVADLQQICNRTPDFCHKSLVDYDPCYISCGPLFSLFPAQGITLIIVICMILDLIQELSERSDGCGYVFIGANSESLRRVWSLPCWDLTETSKRDDDIDLLKDNQALQRLTGTAENRNLLNLK